MNVSTLIPLRHFLCAVTFSSFCLCSLADDAAADTEQEKTPDASVSSQKATVSKTPEEEEKNAALEVREKELALERLQLTQQCTAAELELKKSKAEHQLQAANEDLRQFQTKGRKYAVAAANLQLTRAKNQHEYKQDELKQLKQMYTEDQLTDSSEEIVLKRCLRETEDAQFSYEGKIITTKYEIDVTIPRREQTLKDSVTAAEIEWKRAVLESKLFEKENTVAIEKARASLDQARAAREHKKKELKNAR